MAKTIGKGLWQVVDCQNTGVVLTPEIPERVEAITKISHSVCIRHILDNLWSIQPPVVFAVVLDALDFDGAQVVQSELESVFIFWIFFSPPPRPHPPPSVGGGVVFFYKYFVLFGGAGGGPPGENETPELAR